MIMEISAGLRTPRRIIDYEFDQEWWLKQQQKTWCWEWLDTNRISHSEFFDKNGGVQLWSEWLSGDRSAACRISLLRRPEGAEGKNVF